MDQPRQQPNPQRNTPQPDQRAEQVARPLANQRASGQVIPGGFGGGVGATPSTPGGALYSIRHTTYFRYAAPVHESLMEVRMMPRTEGQQACVDFQLAISPRAKISNFADYLGNTVHVFDIPGQHRHLTITAVSQVNIESGETLPDALNPDAWAEIDAITQAEDYFEVMTPSERTQPTRALRALADELDVRRRGDPLSLVRELNEGIYRAFSYAPSSTQVDSPIDEALEKRQGVCQDFAHVMIALVRGIGLPCRYVSGYLFHRKTTRDRSVADATHAWVEVLLPGGLGWVGFDPTNNLICGERHIRVAVGRDYNAVPPTRGVFKGAAKSELGVAVQVELIEPERLTGSASEPASVTYLPLPELPAQPQQKSQQQAQQQQ